MIYFLLLVETDVLDIYNYIYSKRVKIPSKLIEKKVENAVRNIAKNKVLNLNKIPNEITQRVIYISITILRQIF